MGALMVYQDPDADMGKGEVMIKAVNPLDIYVDPNSKDKFFRDAANVIYASYMTDEVAMQMYPEFADIIEDSAEEPEASDDYPVTNLAKTVDQMFPGDVEDRAHTVRRYLERYTKVIQQFYNVYEPFSEREYLLDDKEFESYINLVYVKVRKITGEESIVWQEEAVEELMQSIEESGPIFHFKLPEPQIDQQTGQMIQGDPIKVPGM